jgi:putative intracellular protease/amidase
MGVLTQPVYYLIFDGLADWECGLALAEVNRSDRYRVVTVGFSTATVTTMGGVRMTPQIVLAELDVDEAAMLIVPGGNRWEDMTEPAVLDLFSQLDTVRVPIAAICGATLAVARAQLLDTRTHTSNQRHYLTQHVDTYRGGDRYVDRPAVTDAGVITASGVASVEFAREILMQLRVYEDDVLIDWFNLFKHGVLPGQG